MLQHCRTENLIVGKDFAAQRQRSEITKRRAAPITAYALTYNEAPQIRDALESIKWADEIIIVDSFSTDGTVEIAREYGARIISEKFCGYGRLRNLALEAADNDWILSIDSDERCTPELAAEVRREAEAPQYDAYHVPRKSHFMGRWMQHSGWYPDYRQPQFFNRRKMRYREDLVHEGFDLDGRLGYLRGHVLQYPWPTIEAGTAKLQRYSTLVAQRYAQMNKRASLFKLICRPISMFLKVYVYKQGFRDGRHGFILATLYAYYTFLKYAKLWELRQNQAVHRAPQFNQLELCSAPTHAISEPCRVLLQTTIPR
ncbi:MAG TPA: glycosyltransferase family 2 protein [Verrucomicrobiae bacterium]|nr:glycosyltransferase family 2 protein [Verrucomicrobiae bacterium]